MEPTVLFRRHSITFRMTVAVCSFFVIFGAVLAALTFFYFKREFKQSITAQQFTLLTVVTQNIDQKLLSSQKIVVNVARSVTPAIAGDSEAAQRFLDSRPGTLSLFDNGLFLFSPDGRIIAESPYLPGRRGRDISFRDYYQLTITTGKPVISAPYFSTHTPGAPAVMFTAPVRDHAGAVIAILGGSLNLMQDNFLGELSRVRIAETGYIYICTRNRTMIMHPDKARIMKNAAQPGVNLLLDRALADFEGTDETVNSSGRKMLTSFKHLHSSDWVMGANYPVEEAYKPIYALQRYFVAALIFGILFSVLVIKLMMERFTSALVRFASHVQNISLKQGKERLFEHESSDEIGILASTFNAMIKHEDQKSEELVHASTHDALTGLYNRACFDSELERLSRGRQMPVSVVVGDIDGLKKCNDTFGHVTGDALIKAAARVLMESFRAEDIVARIGGDEFAVLLPGVDVEQVNMALERVRSMMDEMPLVNGEYRLSISLGCKTCVTADDLPDAFRQADQEMYRHKAARKQVQVQGFNGQQQDMA